MTPDPTSQRARWRRFGTRADDLQVDLAAPRPHAITGVLACCVAPAGDREALWDLPVGKRIERLLEVAALDGATDFDVDLRCQACGGSFEVTLAAEELLEAGRAADRDVVEAGPARFRRPTGRDQLRWLGRAYPDEATLVRDMAATLALDEVPVSLAAVESALDEADPLLRAPVTAACPECGHRAEYETDPAGMALARLARAQDSLFAAVDLLASRYHWSETEILALPEWRRARYVARLEREGR
jgi:hypothetical protein